MIENYHFFLFPPAIADFVDDTKNDNCSENA